MQKKDKVTFIINKLDELYPSVNPPLNHSNNFTLLIAVLLSANSTDKSVNNVTPILFKIADTPRKMLKLTNSLPYHNYKLYFTFNWSNTGQIDLIMKGLQKENEVYNDLIVEESKRNLLKYT